MFQVAFPDTVTITLVVCSKTCGASDLAVNDETVICEYCGKIMKPTSCRQNYRLRGQAAIPKRFERYPEEEYLEDPGTGYVFSAEAPLAYAVCNRGCGYATFINDGGSQVCPKCGATLFREDTGAYEKV